MMFGVHRISRVDGGKLVLQILLFVFHVMAFYHEPDHDYQENNECDNIQPAKSQPGMLYDI